MADYQSTIDSMRAMLAAGERGAEAVAALSVSYAGLCREANDRLRRCVDYLHRGLRTEAVQLAECQPNLIDLAAALDLRERTAWDELCQSVGVMRPPRLSVEAAQELNEAYATHQALAPVLARHRILAVARAPLSLRLGVMRQAAERDRNSPFWEDDLRTFEAARIREMRTEADAAVRKGDQQKLGQLAAELLPNAWHVDIPADLKQALETVARSSRQDQAVRLWQAMLPDLETMYSAQSLEGCAELLNRWRAIGENAGIVPPAELEEQIKPIAEWVMAEERERKTQVEFEALLDKLEDALSADASRRTLEGLHRKAARLGQTIPDWLEKRYMRAIKLHEMAGRRRIRVAAVALIVLLVAGGSLGTWMYLRISRQTKLDRYDAEITACLNAEPQRLSDAQDIWDVLLRDDRKLSDDLRMISLKHQLDDAVTTERRRGQLFDADIQAAKSALTGEPSDAMLSLVEDHLRKAAPRAKLEVEKQTLAALESQAVSIATKLATVRDGAFLKDVRALNAEVDGLKDIDLKADPDAFARKLADLRKSLEDLRAREGVSRIALAELNPPDERLKTWRGRYDALVAELDKNNKLKQLIAEVRKSTVASQVLAAALKTAADALPDSSRKRDFTQAIAEAPRWAAVEEWGRLVKTWAGSLTPDGKQLPDRAAAVAGYLQKFPDSPWKAQIGLYQSFLAQGQQTAAADGAWRTKLTELMKRPLFSGMSCIKTKAGKQYYLEGDGNLKEIAPRVQFTAVLNLDGSKTETISLSIEELDGRTFPAPQREMAKAVLTRLDSMRAEEWDTFAIDVMRAIAEARQVDPILRVIVAQDVIRLIQEQKASWGLDDLWGEDAKVLADVGAGQVNWVNPDDTDAPAVRVKAQDALARLKLNDAREMATKAREAVLAPLRFSPVATGVATREAGQWQIDSAEAIADGLEAMVLVRGATGGGLGLEVAGVAKGGKIECDRNVLDRVVEGTMVFFRQPAKK